jgi:hypothetical protein
MVCRDFEGGSYGLFEGTTPLLNGKTEERKTTKVSLLHSA